jgi:succinylarginine dihydrolase
MTRKEDGGVSCIEVQLDRIVGPTHHFGGLGVGNVASQSHGGQVSNPMAAALQGLDKMRLVASLGARQMILPPQNRPCLAFLRSVGFRGDNREVLRAAREQAPVLLSASLSCSAMWTANAATVTPAVDSMDGMTTLTVANLNASVHRALEPEETWQELRQLLPPSCTIHQPLPGGTAMRDEGAANHLRLFGSCGAGVHLLVYGDGEPGSKRFWPRQTLAASRAIARLHGLDPDFTLFLKQHPAAIDAGAFHNDVVAISDGDLLIHHEFAFQEPPATLERLETRFRQRTGGELGRIVVKQTELSIEDAVATYLFNSQVLSVDREGNRRRVLLSPLQVRDDAKAARLVKRWQDEGRFCEVHHVDLGQSMDGGGGPACLRLRLPLRQEEVALLPSHRTWSEGLDDALRQAIQASYPTSITLDDLVQPDVLEQVMEARKRVAAVLQAD